MSETVAKKESFQLKGSLFTLTVLQLINPELQAFTEQLDVLVSQAPKFFEYAPIVIDLQTLPNPNQTIEFAPLCKILRDRGMIPVGVRGGTQTHHTDARLHGLAILSLSKNDTPEITSAVYEAEPQPQIDEAPKTRVASRSRVITKPVRSGQQVYAQGCDLIIIGTVSQGAEILADGHIHVYGTLRGRALAGINGDTNARIYCSTLEAELVSIAGCYIVNDSLINNTQTGAKQIYLDQGKLQISTL